MNPATRPRTIHAKNDIVSPSCPVNDRKEEEVRPYAAIAHEEQSISARKMRVFPS
jgi:hypothetical protein